MEMFLSYEVTLKKMNIYNFLSCAGLGYYGRSLLMRELSQLPYHVEPDVWFTASTDSYMHNRHKKTIIAYFQSLSIQKKQTSGTCRKVACLQKQIY
jgi:hypothetical protein